MHYNTHIMIHIIVVVIDIMYSICTCCARAFECSNDEHQVSKKDVENPPETVQFHVCKKRHPSMLHQNVAAVRPHLLAVRAFREALVMRLAECPI